MLQIFLRRASFSDWKQLAAEIPESQINWKGAINYAESPDSAPADGYPVIGFIDDHQGIYVAVTGQADGLPFEINSIEQQGNQSMLYGEIAGERVSVVITLYFVQQLFYHQYVTLIIIENNSQA